MCPSEPRVAETVTQSVAQSPDQQLSSSAGCSEKLIQTTEGCISLPLLEQTIWTAQPQPQHPKPAVCPVQWQLALLVAFWSCVYSCWTVRGAHSAPPSSHLPAAATPPSSVQPPEAATPTSSQTPVASSAHPSAAAAPSPSPPPAVTTPPPGPAQPKSEVCAAEGPVQPKLEVATSPDRPPLPEPEVTMSPEGPAQPKLEVSTSSKPATPVREDVTPPELLRSHCRIGSCPPVSLCRHHRTHGRPLELQRCPWSAA